MPTVWPSEARRSIRLRSFSPLGDNGGTMKTCVLLGDANPARQYGMSASDLKILGETLDPAFGEAVSTVDQTGASREGKTVIGAVVK